MRRLSFPLKNCQPVGRADFEARVQRCFRCFLNSSPRFFPPIRSSNIYIYIYIETFRCCNVTVVRTSLRDTRPLLVARPRIEHFVPSRCLVFLRSVGKKNDSLTAACIEDAHVVSYIGLFSNESTPIFSLLERTTFTHIYSHSYKLLLFLHII